MWGRNKQADEKVWRINRARCKRCRRVVKRRRHEEHGMLVCAECLAFFDGRRGWGWRFRWDTISA